MFLAVTLGVGMTTSAAEPSPQLLEYRVKAGFLYDFVKYVEWPAGTFGSLTNSIVIGILGEDPFSNTLATVVAGKIIEGHPIRIERSQRVEQLPVCHVLFISSSETNRVVDILARLRGKNMLTVSDMDRFLQQGGQIHFVTQDGGVGFEINLEATRQAGLKLDANLLRVARRVIRHGDKAKGD